MIPKTLGRFEVVQELGRGAMGVVYKGMDPKLQRPVALKVIQFGMSQEDSEQLQIKERFMVEARATGQLQHSNILTIYDVGEEGNLTYIAMEYLEGGNLEDMIKGNKFHDYEQIMDIAKQIADGLDHAHAKGIVHRDIKPANIMMANGKIPKIADFGLARLSNSTLTTTGTVLGTPSYMAPEQIRGRKVDGRADLFALGVIFYEMLTGEKPYGGDSITSVIYRVVNEEPIPVRKLNLDLPEQMDIFMQKALAKEPSQRFQTGKEFYEGLKALQKGEFNLNASSAGVTQKIPAYEETKKMEAPKAKPNMGLIIGGIAAGVVIIILAVLLFAGGKKEKPAAAPQEPALLTVAQAPPVAEPPSSKPSKTAKQPASTPAQKAEKPKNGKGEKDAAVPPARKQPKEMALTTTVKKAATPAEEPRKKEEQTALLTINSTPEGAKVTLNGAPIGNTPIAGKKMEIDNYDMKVEKEGFAPHTEKFLLKGDMTITVALTQEKAVKEEKKEEKKEPGETGTLIINCKESDTVTVDGSSRKGEPIEIKDISSGRKHNILVIRKGIGRSWLKTVTIKAGETVTVTPEFP